jgi:hypothetical protein
MTRIASRALAVPEQVARIVAQDGIGTGLAGGLGAVDGLGAGEGLGLGVGFRLAIADGVGVEFEAVAPPPQPVSANNKATATPSLNESWNDDRAAVVTRGRIAVVVRCRLRSTDPQ